MTFDEYLSQPCEEDGCDRTAENLNAGRHVCNPHTDFSLNARAMND